MPHSTKKIQSLDEIPALIEAEKGISLTKQLSHEGRGWQSVCKSHSKYSFKGDSKGGYLKDHSGGGDILFKLEGRSVPKFRLKRGYKEPPPEPELKAVDLSGLMTMYGGNEKFQHPYFKSKEIAAPRDVRFKGQTAYIPIYHHGHAEPISYQRIRKGDYSFEKRFKAGHPLPPGHFFKIGLKKTDIAFVCEGVATGASIHKITEKSVFCAFSKGNLDNLARALLKKNTRSGFKVVMALDKDGPGKTHKTAIKDPRLIVLCPAAKGDFNDFQHSEAEQKKLRELSPVYDPGAAPRPEGEIEKDVRARLAGLETELRINERAGRLEWRREGGEWLSFGETERAELYSACHVGTLKKISQADWKMAVTSLAGKKKTDPFKDYLKSLSWDGENRLKGVLPHLFEIKCDKRLAEEGFKLVLLAAVMRTFQPGAKFDLMVILEGPQDIGKSSVWRCLLKESAWFSDSLNFSGADKEILEATLGRVLIENAELMGARKAEIERLKAFISRQSERGRLAYDSRPADRPRRFILTGSTNDPEGLPSDHSGMRRYLPISLSAKAKTPWENGRAVIKYITENRDMLWAEGVELYKAGERPILPEDLQEEAAKEAEAHRSRNEALEQGVLDFVNGDRPFKSFKMAEVLKELAEKAIIGRGNNMAIQKDIAAILRKRGFKRVHTMDGKEWEKA